MLLLALSGVARLALSADTQPPPADKHPFVHGGPGPGGGRFGLPGGMKDTGFDQLSEGEKKRLRTAMEKVWSNPEVVAAKERIMKANEDLRSTLRAALQKSDPDVIPILEKVKAPMPWEQHRGPPPMPRPEDPNFPRLAAARLGFELMTFAKPEQREAFRHLHERVIELPVVKDAISKMQAAPAEGRMEAFKGLRDAYKKECEREIAEYRRKHTGEGSLAAPVKVPETPK